MLLDFVDIAILPIGDLTEKTKIPNKLLPVRLSVNHGVTLSGWMTVRFDWLGGKMAATALALWTNIPNFILRGPKG